MGWSDQFSVHKSVRPSVHTLTDRQLADEYKELTGAPVEVPSTGDPLYWRRWRSDLQLRVLEERVAQLAWWYESPITLAPAEDHPPLEACSNQARAELCRFLQVATRLTR